jgi:hypothetical protein
MLRVGATMDDDPHVIDNGWDALPEYADNSADADDAVTVSISTTPGEWLVNTVDSVVVPMSMAEVVDAMRAHKLTERSLVWRQGMQEWASIDAVPQLKLAARLAPARLTQPEKPSAPPARPTPTPRATPLPQAGLSRRSTLPFGLPTPPGSRPAHARPTLPRSADEPGVLAVYERPAATISFDLSPEQPLPVPPPEPPARGPAPKIIAQQPVTLAPTTSDSAPRSAPPAHRSADLSVVLAADFRAVKRTGKRMVLAWSLASAAAASLLTFWLSRTEGAGAPATASRPAAGVALTPSTPVVAPPPPVPAPAPLESAATVHPVASAAPEKPVPPRPKAKPVARRVKPPPAVRIEPSATETPSPGNTKSPESEPNPYDVKLDDEAPATKPSPSPSSGSDDSPSNEPSTDSGSKAPGF